MRARRFEDKVVWITGGSSGIGEALAREFATEGAHVAVSGRRQERLQANVAEIEALGGRGLAVPCDVTDDDAVQQAVATVLKEFGRLDVAVANAGFGVAGRIEDLTRDDWVRQFNTNVFGVVATVRAALPALRKTDGRLVLMGSVTAYVSSVGLGAYSASKHAVRAIGETLAMELAGTGVSCTTVHPGYVESEIAQVDNQGRFDPAREDRRPSRLLWRTNDAARVIVNAIHRRKREFVFTGHGRLLSFVGQHTPGLVHQVVAHTSAGKNRKRAQRHQD